MSKPLITSPDSVKTNIDGFVAEGVCPTCNGHITVSDDWWVTGYGKDHPVCECGHRWSLQLVGYKENEE